MMLLEEGRLGSLCHWYQERPMKNQYQQYAHVILKRAYMLFGLGHTPTLTHDAH